MSLVIGGKYQGRVSQGTAESVRAAARELGYRPNLAARSLRLGRTRTALLVVPSLTNEFFARLHAGAALAAAEHAFGVVIYPSPAGPARDPFDSSRTALDGVIASSMNVTALTALRKAGLPLVMLDSDPEQPYAAATVNVDIASGMRQMCGHLLTLGHRHIAHIASSVASWTFRTRARALADVLGQTPNPVTLRTERAELSVSDGLRAAQLALSQEPRPTALICDNDVLAAGAYKAVRRHGMRVPRDVSVTGFDDLSLATALEPELTTVRLPAEAVGAAGMRALLAVLDGQAAENSPLPVEVVRRASTAPPTGHSPNR